MLREYYRLAKPGIVYGNLLAAAAGYLYGAGADADATLLALMLLGLGLSIASACVYNNILDRTLDSKMARTKDRALPAGRISPRDAEIFASILLLAGTAVLFVFTNPLTLLVLVFGFWMYLFVYTPLKTRSPHFTYAGALAGAVPPVIGYVTATATLDSTALTLYLILCTWQMAHFYAIAIRRADEYKAGGVNVLPLRIGARKTKWAIVAYIIAFCAASFTLPFTHRVGSIYFPAMTLVSLAWLLLGLFALRSNDDVAAAKRLFLFSLVVLLTLCAALAI